MNKNNDDPFATEPAFQAVPVEAPPEPAKEPNKRLTYKQTHLLILYCQKVPTGVHETWVAMAAAATEELGFRVTTYSLREALEAADRQESGMLKAHEEVTFESLKESVAKMEKLVVAVSNEVIALKQSVGLLTSIVDKAIDQVPPISNL